MKKFACRDAGMNCDWTTTGQNDEEVMKKAAEHGRQRHNMDKLTPEMQQKVRTAIKEA